MLLFTRTLLPYNQSDLSDKQSLPTLPLIEAKRRFIFYVVLLCTELLRIQNFFYYQ